MKKLILVSIILLFFLPVSSYSRMIIVGAGGPDVTPPTLQSVTIGTNGTTWTFVFSESVTFGGGGNGGWAVTMSGAGAVGLTYASGSGTSTLIYTGSPTVGAGETVSAGLDYTQPGDGVEDLSGNDLASIDDAVVVNNSTQGNEEDCTGGCIWVASWTGTDVLNSGTSYIWDTVQDAGGFLSLGTTSGYGFNGVQSEYLVLSGNLTNYAFLREAVTATSQGGWRLGFYVSTGFSATNTIMLKIFRGSTMELMYFTYGYDGSNHYVKASVGNSGSTFTELTDGSTSKVNISTGMWYQLIGKFQKNTAGDSAGAGGSFEVYNSSGQVGNTKNLATGTTTKNESIANLRMGSDTSPSITANLRFDVFRFINTYAFPDMLSW